MIDYILEALHTFILWFFSLFSSIGDAVISIILALIPGLPETFNSQIMQAYAIANAWFPFDFAMTLFLAWVSAALWVILVRWVKSFVPTISN